MIPMAENSLYTLSDKPYVSPPNSTNHNAEIMKGLHELKIAFRVMSGHPEILQEFKRAVVGGANHPAVRPTAPVEEVVVRRDAA
jgi:hypothetical protein